MSLSLDEAVALITEQTNLKADEIQDVLSPQLTDDMRQQIIQSYRDAQASADPQPWITALTILKAVAEVATVISPLADTISTVYGLAQILKVSEPTTMTTKKTEKKSADTTSENELPKKRVPAPGESYPPTDPLHPKSHFPKTNAGEEERAEKRKPST